MVGRRHLGINRGNIAVRPDEDRNACGARRIRFRRAIGEGHRFIRVTHQIIGKAELLLERHIVFRAVHTAAENDGVFTFEILDSITEPIAFDRSPWGISFRIPPDQNVFSRMVDKRNRIAVLVRNAEGRGLITNFDHCINSLFTSVQLLTDSLVSVHRIFLRTANLFVPILSGGCRFPSAIYVLPYSLREHSPRTAKIPLNGSDVGGETFRERPRSRGLAPAP